MVDASHEKESRAKETIQSLKIEISNLTKLVEQGAGLSVGQENRLGGYIYYVYRSLLLKCITVPITQYHNTVPTTPNTIVML